MAETGTSDGQRRVTLPGLVWSVVLLEQIRYWYKLPPRAKGYSNLPTQRGEAPFLFERREIFC